jgi:hypothetical protein
MMPRGIKSFESIINKTTTSVLALHPVTCVLAFLALLIAMHAAWRPSRRAYFFTLVMSGIAGLVGTIVLFVDIAVVAISEKNLKNATSNTLDITWGNAVSASCCSCRVICKALMLELLGMDVTRYHRRSLDCLCQRFLCYLCLWWPLFAQAQPRTTCFLDRICHSPHI